MTYNAWLLIGGVIGIIVGAKIFETDRVTSDTSSQLINEISTKEISQETLHRQNYGSIEECPQATVSNQSDENIESLKPNVESHSDQIIVVSAEIHDL